MTCWKQSPRIAIVAQGRTGSRCEGVRVAGAGAGEMGCWRVRTCIRDHGSRRRPWLLAEGAPTSPLMFGLLQVLPDKFLELPEANNQAEVFDSVFVEPPEDGVQGGEQQDERADAFGFGIRDHYPQDSGADRGETT